MSQKTIHIAHKVMGSLTTEQGDTVLSYTRGVSQDAGSLCLLTGQGAPSGYASLYVLTHFRGGVLHIAHVQGNHTVFAGGVRNYATRAVYECTLGESDNVGGYLPILKSLDAMRHYDTPDYGASDVYHVEFAIPHALDADEQLLNAYIAYCLVHDVRLLIHLGADECLYADTVRQSPRLAILLRAIDHLPPLWRHRISLAWAVEYSCVAAVTLLHQLDIVAHTDDADHWTGADSKVLRIDWTGLHPQPVDNQVPDEASCTEAISFVDTNDPPESTSTDVTINTDNMSSSRGGYWFRWIIITLIAAAAIAAFLFI